MSCEGSAATAGAHCTSAAAVLPELASAGELVQGSAKAAVQLRDPPSTVPRFTPPTRSRSSTGEGPRMMKNSSRPADRRGAAVDMR